MPFDGGKGSNFKVISVVKANVPSLPHKIFDKFKLSPFLLKGF